MKYLLYVFYLEILLNLASIYQAFFAPAAFLGQFSNEPTSIAALEVTRWYGVLIAMISYLLFRALQKRGQVLKVVLEALLVGDVIQIIAGFMTAKALGQWPPVVLIAVIFSIVYGLIRIFCLWKANAVGLA